MLKYLCACVGIACILGVGNQASALQATGGFASPYFQADYIQDISDFSSGLVNPALLYRVDQLHFQFGIYRWNFDLDVGTTDLGYQQSSFIVPIRLHQTAGLSVIGVGSRIDSIYWRSIRIWRSLEGSWDADPLRYREWLRFKLAARQS